jgi:hypothetical protein
MQRSRQLTEQAIELRNSWVTEISELTREKSALEPQLDPKDPGKAIRIRRLLSEKNERISELLQLYRAWLPVLPISRCPICKQLVKRSVDIVGLNGPWWDYYSPTRKESGYRDPHMIGFDGAVHQLEPTPPYYPLVKPGPQAPFVIPRILGIEGVFPVLFGLQVGSNRAYAITYFAESYPESISLVNDWGTHTYAVPAGRLDSDGNMCFGWNEAYNFVEDYDFDLEPWIANKKLLWISEDDREMALHNRVENCPYLDVPGLREQMFMRNGKTWSSADVRAHIEKQTNRP